LRRSTGCKRPAAANSTVTNSGLRRRASSSTARTRALFDAIAPVLSDYLVCRGARIELRQGEETMEFVLGSTTLQ
jgi:hypothetical protein